MKRVPHWQSAFAPSEVVHQWRRRHCWHCLCSVYLQLAYSQKRTLICLRRRISRQQLAIEQRQSINWHWLQCPDTDTDDSLVDLRPVSCRQVSLCNDYATAPVPPADDTGWVKWNSIFLHSRMQFEINFSTSRINYICNLTCHYLG